MRNIAIGILAAAGIAVAAPAHAQGLWFGTPGFSIGIGFGPSFGYGYGSPYYSSAFWAPGAYWDYAAAPAYYRSYYRWNRPYWRGYRAAWRYNPGWYGNYAYSGNMPFFGFRTYAYAPRYRSYAYAPGWRGYAYAPRYRSHAYAPGWRGYAYAPRWHARVHVRHGTHRLHRR